MENSRYLVSYFSDYVISELQLDIVNNTPIYISDNNIQHIRENHSDAYIKYFDSLSDIISDPDYIGIAGVKSKSVEYIKSFNIDGEYVNVAVRATKNGVYYIRSMFIIEDGRINDYLKNDRGDSSFLIKVDKSLC